MEKTSPAKNNTLDTILTLGGILLGAFLITKFTHEDNDKPLLNKDFVKPKTEPVKNFEKKEKEKLEEGLNERQTKILVALKEKGLLTPKDLQNINPEVSTRTLRRDMDLLAKKKYVSQKGNTKSTFYKYIGR